MKIGRWGGAVTATGNCVYAVGGFDWTHYQDTVDIFDTKMERWRLGAKLNVRRSEEVSCLISQVIRCRRFYVALGS